MTKRCYICFGKLDSDWSGWSALGHNPESPPKCDRCKREIEHARQGEERRRGA